MFKQLFLKKLLLIVMAIFLPNYISILEKTSRSPASKNKNEESQKIFKVYNADQFISLSPGIELHGAIHKQGETVDYVKSVFGLIVQQAHQLVGPNGPASTAFFDSNIDSKGNLIEPATAGHSELAYDSLDNTAPGEPVGKIVKSDSSKFIKLANEGYWAFMVMALAVPQHESHLSHFREVDSSRCNSKANSLRGMPLNSKVVLDKHWKKKDMIPSCADYKSGETIPQISFSVGDMGLFQFNVHYNKEVISSGKIWDLEEVIAHALGETYLYGTFSKLLLDGMVETSRYRCMMSGKKKVDWVDIIRGIWAGRYNAGSESKACRYRDSFSCLKKLRSKLYWNKRITKKYQEYLQKNKYGYYKKDRYYTYLKNHRRLKNLATFDDSSKGPCRNMKNDIGFYKNLYNFINKKQYQNGKFVSNFLYFLPEGSIERNALLEILDNFKKKTNKHKFIDLVLKTKYDQSKRYKFGMDEKGLFLKYPEFNEQDYIYIITKQNYQVYKKLPVIKENSCANISHVENRPIVVEKIQRETKNYYKIYGKELRKIGYCPDQDYYYIHRSAISRIRKAEYIGRVKITGNSLLTYSLGPLPGRTLELLRPGETLLALRDIWVAGKVRYFKVVSKYGKIGFVSARSAELIPDEK